MKGKRARKTGGTSDEQASNEVSINKQIRAQMSNKQATNELAKHGRQTSNERASNARTTSGTTTS